MTAQSARIRRARAADAPVLTEIAHAAKRHWGYPDELMELWDADLTVTPDFAAAPTVFCVAEGERVLGFYALSRDGVEFELEHMWVAPPFMGRGLGAMLFAHATATARSMNGAVLRIASDPHAEGFYRRMGARRVGEAASTPSGRMLPLLVVDLTPQRGSAAR
jgi:GNAT superfamily N-acetyltransferase